MGDVDDSDDIGSVGSVAIDQQSWWRAFDAQPYGLCTVEHGSRVARKIGGHTFYTWLLLSPKSPAGTPASSSPIPIASPSPSPSSPQTPKGITAPSDEHPLTTEASVAETLGSLGGSSPPLSRAHARAVDGFLGGTDGSGSATVRVGDTITSADCGDDPLFVRAILVPKSGSRLLLEVSPRPGSLPASAVRHVRGPASPTPMDLRGVVTMRVPALKTTSIYTGVETVGLTYGREYVMDLRRRLLGERREEEHKKRADAVERQQSSLFRKKHPVQQQRSEPDGGVFSVTSFLGSGLPSPSSVAPVFQQPPTVPLLPPLSSPLFGSPPLPFSSVAPPPPFPPLQLPHPQSPPPPLSPSTFFAGAPQLAPFGFPCVQQEQRNATTLSMPLLSSLSEAERQEYFEFLEWKRSKQRAQQEQQNGRLFSN